MPAALDLATLRDIVARHFRVYDAQEDKVRGQVVARRFYIMYPPAEFDARYEGVRRDLKAADPALLAFLRRDGGEDILFVAERPPDKPQNIALRVVLLAATMLTTTVAGAFWWHGYHGDVRDLTGDLGATFSILWAQGAFLGGFVSFAVPLLLILGIHEGAHYVVARRHGLRANLPMFIPAPLMIIGTFGAFISLKDPLPDRKALFDVGAAGPLAGFFAALPVVVLGLFLTNAGQVAVPDIDRPELAFDLPGAVLEPDADEGRALLSANDPPAGVYVLDVTAHPKADDWVFVVEQRTTAQNGTVATSRLGGSLDGGEHRGITVEVPPGTGRVEVEVAWDPHLSTFGEPLLVQGLHWIFPTPPGVDYLTHPTYFAGWVGLLVTGLNLLPTGQLDGGHVSRAVFGESSRHVARAALGLLVVLALFFDTWLLMALFVLLTGIYHPPPLNDRTPLDPRRKAVAAFVLLVFVVTFVPVPFEI
jgi:hypothetical protein